MEKEELLTARWRTGKVIGDMDREELLDVILWHSNAYLDLLDRSQTKDCDVGRGVL